MASLFEHISKTPIDDFADSFWRRGFAVARGVFSRREVDRLKRAFDALQATANALGRDGKVMHEGTQFVIDHEADFTRIHRVVWCAGVSNVLDRMGRDPRLLARVGQLLKSNEFDQLINQAHFKMPGDGVEFEWHQDSRHRRYGTQLWTDIDGKGSFVETLTAVDPMTSENGPLRFIPGSHLFGHVTDSNGQLPPELVDESKAVTLQLDPGDIVFFGPFVFHASGPNQSDQPRRAFLNGFALPGSNRRVYPGEGAGRMIDVSGEVL